MAGTIYIRDNQWFSQLGLYKVGKASCAKDRSSTYLTSEPIPGKYVMVVEVGDKMDIVDKLMKNYFKTHQKYFGGGTEYYDRCIEQLLEPFIKSLNKNKCILFIMKSTTTIQCKCFFGYTLNLSNISFP